ncbi:hypothetical protein GDO81_009585 [Engystomops pustulosus]|uniref:Uncharacterized protein n=1 Tax=Engystomops pustulosus TaxID=76066 RepID=A0AAV7BSR4_ENGPU|nr:hypothetical protein GDO81_009585 [Engystomops pustulosus]
MSPILSAIPRLWNYCASKVKEQISIFFFSLLWHLCRSFLKIVISVSIGKNRCMKPNLTCNLASQRKINNHVSEVQHMLEYRTIISNLHLCNTK